MEQYLVSGGCSLRMDMRDNHITCSPREFLRHALPLARMSKAAHRLNVDGVLSAEQYEQIKQLVDANSESLRHLSLNRAEHIWSRHRFPMLRSLEINGSWAQSVAILPIASAGLSFLSVASQSTTVKETQLAAFPSLVRLQMSVHDEKLFSKPLLLNSRQVKIVGEDENENDEAEAEAEWTTLQLEEVTLSITRFPGAKKWLDGFLAHRVPRLRSLSIIGLPTSPIEHLNVTRIDFGHSCGAAAASDRGMPTMRWKTPNLQILIGAMSWATFMENVVLAEAAPLLEDLVLSWWGIIDSLSGGNKQQQQLANKTSLLSLSSSCAGIKKQLPPLKRVSLRHSWSDVLALPADLGLFSRSLTELEIDSVSSDCTPGSPDVYVWSTLRQLPVLARLHLNIEVRQPIVESLLQAEESASSTNLRVLRLLGSGFRDMPRLIASLHAPNLEELASTAGLLDLPGGRAALEAHFPKLRFLRFGGSLSGCYDQSRHPTGFTSFPSLQLTACISATPSFAKFLREPGVLPVLYFHAGCVGDKSLLMLAGASDLLSATVCSTWVNVFPSLAHYAQRSAAIWTNILARCPTLCYVSLPCPVVASLLRVSLPVYRATPCVIDVSLHRVS